MDDDVKPEKIRKYLSLIEGNVSEIRHVLPSLEDVFIALTKMQNANLASERR